MLRAKCNPDSSRNISRYGLKKYVQIAIGCNKSCHSNKRENRWIALVCGCEDGQHHVYRVFKETF